MKSQLLAILSLSFLLSCSSGSGDTTAGDVRGGVDGANFGCDGSCVNQSLSGEDVTTILQRAVAGASLLNVKGTFAIVDRVGNVLGVYQMPGALLQSRIDGQIGAHGGLEGALIPTTLAAISKAGTGAYLSSQGNAFSTRTASQIIQEHFNPGEDNQPGGPLFGVQFSQLPCSDVTRSLAPRPLPLGLSADPGGIPLYKAGDLVGGIGIEINGLYSLDRNIQDSDDDIEERIALIAASGFETPSEIAADKISVGGRSLRFVDLSYSELEAVPMPLPELEPNALVAVPPFFSGKLRSGTIFGAPGSGMLLTQRGGLPAMQLVDGAGNDRFPTSTSSPLPGGVQLTPTEVDALLDSALLTAYRARAAIRRPLDSAARVSIWIVDTAGKALGFTRSPDAPVFGVDVSLQKARTALFFSSVDARQTTTRAGLGRYVAATDAVISGDIFAGAAITARAIGNLARPFLPDGVNASGLAGTLSLNFADGSNSSWSPFNTGLQLDLILSSLLAPLQGTIPASCTSAVFGHRLQNGMQIFPGAVPLYRGGVLIGAIGVSGDGIDQDDLVAFYGASRAGLDAAAHPEIGDAELGFNAPQAIRSDALPTTVENVRLRYVNCPEAPFRGSNEQGVCEN